MRQERKKLLLCDAICHWIWFGELDTLIEHYNRGDKEAVELLEEWRDNVEFLGDNVRKLIKAIVRSWLQ